VGVFGSVLSRMSKVNWVPPSSCKTITCSVSIVVRPVFVPHYQYPQYSPDPSVEDLLVLRFRQLASFLISFKRVRSKSL